MEADTLFETSRGEGGFGSTGTDKKESEINSIVIVSSDEKIQVKKLSDFATIPSRGSPVAAGLDLSSAVDSVVPARGKVLVKTDDITITIPENTYARIASYGRC